MIPTDVSPPSPTGRTALLGWLLLSLLAPGPAEAGAQVAAEVEIAPSDLAEGREHSFEGHTTYTLVELDGRSALHAACEGGAASALIHEREIDLEETPVVEWRWRVGSTLDGVDETTEAGDDYPARLYLVEETGFFSWSALNYVWAHSQPEGADWPNAYEPEVRMVAVRSGPPEDDGRWRIERRNALRDFRRLHEGDVTELAGVAVMTDCDDTGRPLEGWYGAVRFLEE